MKFGLLPLGFVLVAGQKRGRGKGKVKGPPKPPPSSAILATPEEVDLDQLYKNERSIEGRNFLSIADMVTARLKFLDPDGDFSGTEGWIYENVLAKIQQYGCYCFIDNRFGATTQSLEGNKGTPIDDMDKLCLDLYRCHRCIYDFDHPASDCTVESRYQSMFNDGTGEADCLPGNTPCQDAQCNCDKSFAYKLADLWTNQDDRRKTKYVFDRYYWKNVKNGKAGPTFGYKTQCVSGGPMGNTADACCGGVGDKKPYNSLLSGCCDDKLAALGTC